MKRPLFLGDQDSLHTARGSRDLLWVLKLGALQLCKVAQIL